MNFQNNYYKNPSLLKIKKHYEKVYVAEFEQVKKNWNQLIRNFLSKSMGVSLSEEDNRLQIPIRFEVAPDEDFLDLIERNFPELDFEELFTLTKFLENARKSQPYFTDPKAEQHLKRSIDFAEYRLRDFEIDHIIKELFMFLKPENPDVFGCYFIESKQVVLYVVPMVLFTQLLGLDLQAFIVKVLTHELSHAYNHIGRDKDGHYWENFGCTDNYLAEGLANYYTNEFITKYQYKNPNLLPVFHETLKYQPDCYSVFKEWDASLEQTYRAFIETRRNHVMDYQTFFDFLKISKQRIKY